MYVKDKNDELILQGKVEAELILLASDDAEKSPAGPEFETGLWLNAKLGLEISINSQLYWG